MIAAMKNPRLFRVLILATVGVTFPTSSLLFGQTVTPATTSYSFGSVNVCAPGNTTPGPCSATHTVSFNVAAGTTIGAIDIVLQGAPNLDFKAEAGDTSPSLCAAKLYSEATTCTVDVTFAPLAPGARNGAVEILDTSGGVLATTYMSGIGVGPQIAFSPSSRLSYGLGDYDIFAYINLVDGSGNIFIFAAEDEALSSIAEFTAASGYKSATLLTTAWDINAVAMDGAGNLFVFEESQAEADEGMVEVRELFAEGNYNRYKTLFTADLGFFGDRPGNVAMDGAGNLFFAFGATVQEYLAAGGYKKAKTLASGFDDPTGVAIDGSGNIFIADDGSSTLKEILAAGGYTTVKTLQSNLSGPDGLALDAAGDLFVVLDSSETNSLVELVPTDGYSTINTLLTNSYAYGTGSGFPHSVRVDGNGNIYTIFPAGKILKLVRSKPAALQFTPANVDSTSSDSPLSVTVQNSGNTTLTGSGFAFSDAVDFTHAAGSGTPPDCTAGFSLAPGAECSLGVDFTPASAGTLTGSLLLTDNAGNAAVATQTIALSGNGITAGGPVAHVSATALNYGSVAYPGTATQSLTVTNSGGGKLTMNPSVSSQNFKITGNTCAAGVTTGSCILQVEFTPTSVGPQPNQLTLATDGPTNPIISLTGTATGITLYGGYPKDFGVETIPSVNFGTVYFPSTDVQTSVSLSVGNVGVPGSPTVKFSIDGADYQVFGSGCSSPGIKNGQVCSVFIEFSPLTLGAHYEHLIVTPSVGASSTIELTGVAEGTLP